MKKEVEEPTEWDKKRIAIGLIIVGVLLIIGLEGKKMFLDKNPNVLGQQAQSVKEIEPPQIKSDIQKQLAPKVEDIKQDVESLNVEEIATSSPQIQKVLNDIKGIKDLPANQARQACMNICSNL